MNTLATRQSRPYRIAQKIKTDLQQGKPVADKLFDGLLSHLCHDLAAIHWTPIAVVQAALGLLQPQASNRILDIGSGCGKFCLVAAMYGPGNYSGIELRPQLVAEAQEIQALFGQDRVNFIQGDAVAADWTPFDCLYMFNPFYEALLPPDELRPRYIDTQIDLRPAQFRRYVLAIQAKLADSPIGTKLLSYHGFGGELPASYRSQGRVAVGTDYVELWVQAR